MTFGDCHLYMNHLEQADEQLSRAPRALPKMKLNTKIRNILDFSYEDFELESYDPLPTHQGSCSDIKRIKWELQLLSLKQKIELLVLTGHYPGICLRI